MSALPHSVAPEPYVVVTVPRSLEASARLAIAGLYQPFFVEWGQDGIVLVARALEWDLVAARFPGATARTGFRLISLAVPPAATSGPAGISAEPATPPPLASADLAVLVRTLERQGIRMRTLRSFYRDHLLVAEEDLATCLEVLATFPRSSPDSPSGG